MVKGTVTQIIGDSVTIAISAAMTGAGSVSVGDAVVVSAASERDLQMEEARRVMDLDRNLLRELAKR